MSIEASLMLLAATTAISTPAISPASYPSALQGDWIIAEYADSCRLARKFGSDALLRVTAHAIVSHESEFAPQQIEVDSKLRNRWRIASIERFEGDEFPRWQMFTAERDKLTVRDLDNRLQPNRSLVFQRCPD